MSGAVQWRMTRMPKAGGIGEQDARLIQCLELMRREQNLEMDRERKRQAKGEKEGRKLPDEE